MATQRRSVTPSSTNIQTVWATVAEDFAPFNIDVTTVEPSVLADNAPPTDANGVAMRVAIGGKSTDWYSPTVYGWLGLLQLVHQRLRQHRLRL